MADVYRADRFEIHPARRAVRVDGADVDIGARAFDLLIVLVEHRDRVVSKRELLQRGWPGLVVEENTLQAQISLLRKRLGAQSIATVARRGYRFVVPVSVDVGDDTATSPLTVRQAMGLPSFGGRFVGRGVDLADCLRLLGANRLLTLTGMGGTGKTRLAVELAQALAARPSAVWFVDLSSVCQAAQITSAITLQMGVRERSDTGLHDALKRRIEQTSGTLILDNCEHIADDVAAVVVALAPLDGNVRIVATSRQPLGVRGEQIYPVRPLSLPAAADLASALHSEAVQLFLDRTRLIDPGFVLDDHNVAPVSEVCLRLDGIPLAIELAAARMKLLSAQQLRARLNARFELLTGGTGTLARQQTLRASMQWSYELLAPAAQRMLREIAVFAGGWTLEAATGVCTAGDELKTLEVLTSLYDKSLLVVETRRGERRYRMLQMVREYAQEATVDPLELPLVRTRHLMHFVGLVEALIPSTQAPLDAAASEHLRDEQENLLAALEWSRVVPDGASFALRLAGSLWPFWLATAQLEQGSAFTSRALTTSSGSHVGGSDAERALALLGFGNIAFYRGRYDEALKTAEACLLHARRARTPVVVGFALKLRAGGHHALGDDRRALDDYQAALDIAIQTGELALQASALNNLAEVHRGLGDLAAAESSYLRAVTVGHESGEIDKIAFVMCNLARLFAMSGRLEQAFNALGDAHEIAIGQALRRAGDEIIDIAAGLASLGNDHVSAARLYGASLSRMQDSGSQREPVDEAFLAPLIAGSRAALGERRFEAVREEGAAIDYGQAMRDVEQLRRRMLVERRAPPRAEPPSGTTALKSHATAAPAPPAGSSRARPRRGCSQPARGRPRRRRRACRARRRTGWPAPR